MHGERSMLFVHSTKGIVDSLGNKDVNLLGQMRGSDETYRHPTFVFSRACQINKRIIILFETCLVPEVKGSLVPKDLNGENGLRILLSGWE